MSTPPTTAAAQDPEMIARPSEGTAPLGRFHRPGVRTAAVVIALLVATELVARVLSGGLPNPDWNFAQTDRKVAEMEAMAAAGDTVDVVLIGNSSVNAAFVTEDLEARSGLGTFFNAGLDGSSMRQAEDWTLNVVLPLISPDMVVIGLTSRDLNDASISNAEVFDKYLDSRGRASFLGRETAGQRVQQTLSRASALVRISPFLRDPASLITRYNPDGPDTGEFVLPGEAYNPRALDVTRTRERALNDYSLGGVEFQALSRLVTQLESMDIEVVIVEMPFVAGDYLDMHPNGADDYEAYRRVVSSFTVENDLEYIDLTDFPWTTDEFYDFLHVNSTGIAIVDAIVADALAATAG